MQRYDFLLNSQLSNSINCVKRLTKRGQKGKKLLPKRNFCRFANKISIKQAKISRSKQTVRKKYTNKFAYSNNL